MPGSGLPDGYMRASQDLSQGPWGTQEHLTGAGGAREGAGCSRPNTRRAHQDRRGQEHRAMEKDLEGGLCKWTALWGWAPGEPQTGKQRPDDQGPAFRTSCPVQDLDFMLKEQRNKEKGIKSKRANRDDEIVSQSPPRLAQGQEALKTIPPGASPAADHASRQVKVMTTRAKVSTTYSGAYSALGGSRLP